jgi:uncharacterized protein
MNCRMSYRMVNKAWLFVCFFFLSVQLLGQDIPAKPSGYVLDQVGLLQANEIQQLEQKLRGYADSTSTQFAIVLVATTGNSDPYDYAMEIGKTWGVGQKGKNNGVVILVSMNNRKIRIVTGRGIEDVLPDATCKRIITRILKPSFKRGSYFAGLDEATTEMMLRASGQFTADGKSDSEGIPAIVFIILALVILSIIKAYRNRGGGGSGPGSHGGGMFFPPVFFGGGGFGGRGGSSGGGGGFDFGGFGGGDFGGGGAGGDF